MPDAVILCVPTPLTKNRDPDLSYIIQDGVRCSAHLWKGRGGDFAGKHDISGNNEDILGKALDETGYADWQRCLLIYSPEREDPGRADFTTQSIPKLVAGHTPSCLKIGMALYGQIVDTPVGTSSLKVAEMAKILENVQRAVNIGLMNEMKLVADAMKLIFSKSSMQLRQSHLDSQNICQARPWWTLHSHRPFLSDLESQGIRRSHKAD